MSDKRSGEMLSKRTLVGATNSSLDVCTCICHEEGSRAIHCMPCCNVCPHCKENIKIGAYQAHVEGCAPKFLQEFFAVTKTSTYHVAVVKGQGCRATKIAQHSESSCQVGSHLEGGQMIAVAVCLIAYLPEGHGFASCLTSVERRIENVNTQWWGGHSSPIVALFLDRESAETCAKSEDLQTCDPRWKNQTLETLKGIGEEHPYFYVCRGSSLELPLTKYLYRLPQS